MKVKVKFLFGLIACAVSVIVSCEDNIIVSKYEIIQGIGTGGDFSIINMGTNDTLKVSGALNINLDGSNPTLTAHSGNIIKIKFEKKEEYKDYSFNTTYTLPNDEVITDKTEYEYTVGNDLNGPYNIYLSASSSGNTSNKSWDISAFGAFVLNVVE